MKLTNIVCPTMSVRIKVEPFESYERSCEAYLAGESSSFIFTFCVKSIPLYHFKLAYVALRMDGKEFLNPTSENGALGFSNLQSHF